MPWGSKVVSGKVNGHPCLLYENRPQNVTEVLNASLRWSDRQFIIHGDRRVTFGEHHRAVTVVASRLVQQGVRPGSRVAIYARNSAEWVVVFFAILRAGAIAAPCNGWWSAEELRHATDVVAPDMIIVDSPEDERLPRHLLRVPIRDLVDQEAWAGQDEQQVTADSAITEDQPAVIVFTAGTTSFPKGAVLSHRAVIANLQTLLVVSRKLPHQIPDDIAPSVSVVGLPLFHIGAIQLVIYPLMTGSKIVFLAGRFDPREFLRLTADEAVTMFSGVPTMMERILTAAAGIPNGSFGSLRTVVLGGSPVSADLLSRVHQAFPNTRRRVGQTYGLTEAGGVVSTGVGAQIEAHPGSAGRIAPVVEVRIDEPDQDGIGEIVFRSPAGMDGYWGLDHDAAQLPEGWIRTGDLGRTDEDGYLYLTGRAKDVIIRGGENIAAARVEAVLQANPHVLEAAVVGLPHADLGEEVGAVISVAEDVDVRELSAWASRSLAHFEVPSRWWLRHTPLPVNDAGKILKARLREEWLDREVTDDSASSPRQESSQ
jgi:long-chain acyl-CoA synthetase